MISELSMTSIIELLPSYSEYLMYERQLAQATMIAYISDLHTLESFLQKPIESVVSDDLRAFMRHMSKAGKQTTTIRRKMHGFTTFWQWLRLQGIVTKVLTEDLHLPKRPRKTPNWLSHDELLRFLTAERTDTTAFAQQRDSMAFKTLAWLGLRRGELLNLLVEDIDLNKGIVVIKNGKGRRDRELPIPDALTAEFESYLNEVKPGHYLFPSAAGKFWKPKFFAAAFHDQLRAAGLEGKGITPHTLRHTFATHLIRQGVHITTLKELLGHQDLGTTMVYVHHDPATLREAMQRHILNKVK